MQDHFTSSGKRSERNTLFNIFCFEGISFANQGGGARPKYSALRASQRFVYRALTERVTIVIAIVV